MRRIARYLKENKQDFIKRVDTVMMDDFASEFMKTEDDKITISYLIFQYDIFQYDLDDLVGIDYLFDWQTKEKVDNWYQIDVTVNRNDWEAWDKAIKCENDWVINNKRKGIYNVKTGDFIDGKENWELKDSLLPICFIRHILAYEIKRINADLRRLNNWVNNSNGKGLEA